jgi:hypothetical protein
MNNANDLPDTEVRQIGRIVETMSTIFESNPESVKRLIIPIVEQYHFFVLCMDVSFNAPKFIVRARFYDSLQRRTRRVNQSTTAANIVTEVNKFFRHFDLQDKKYKKKQMSDLKLLELVEFDECPPQTNGHDCGLFAVAVVLHLVEGKEVNSQTFRQLDITILRKRLEEVFLSDHRVWELRELFETTTVSAIVRNCFPALRGTSIVDIFGVETIGTIRPQALGDLVDSAATVIAKVEENEVIDVWTAKEGNDASKNPTKAAVAKGVVNINDDDDDDDNDYDVNNDDDDDDEQDEDDDIDYSDEECDVNESDDEELSRERDKGNVLSLAGTTAEQPESSLSGTSEDTLFYKVMKEMNKEGFATLEDASPIVEAYEVRSGNSLAIKRSKHDKFRQYRCREHIDCPFQILLSKRRSDGMFCVSRMKCRHAEMRRPTRAADGRNWKKRRHAKLDDILEQVICTKSNDPTPADLIKLAATK